jgi:hypothetical protein
MTKLLILTALAVLAAVPAQAAPRISDIVPIPLQSGVNRVPALAPDGREGLVVLGWRDNGNAHGYDLALVLLRGGRGAPWNVVHTDPALDDNTNNGLDAITDIPHTGDDMVRAFRLARGNVDGKPATLLLMATRDPGDGIPAPSHVSFDVWRLEHAPDVGTTPDHFAPILHDRSRGPFCNADMALSRRFGLALRASYAGKKT